MDLFEEMADMMANSLSVGPYCTRQEILTALHKRFATEDELRAFRGQMCAALEGWQEDAKQSGCELVLVVPAVPDHLKH